MSTLLKDWLCLYLGIERALTNRPSLNPWKTGDGSETMDIPEDFPKLILANILYVA